MAKRSALAKVKPLTELQRQFAEAYVWETRGNALAAWRVSHPTSKANPMTAVKDAQRLMRRPAVQAEIAQQQAQRRVMLMTNYDVTVERTVQELAAIGYADMRDYLSFGDDGQVLLDWSGMGEMASKAIAEITQDEFIEGRGDNARTVRRTKFKLHDKGGALSDLARHLDMFKGKGDEDTAKAAAMAAGQVTQVFIQVGEQQVALGEWRRLQLQGGEGNGAGKGNGL